MKNCVICDEMGSISMGGILFCRMHEAEAKEQADRLHAEGKSVSMAKIALAMRKENEATFVLHFPTADMRQKLKIHAAEKGVSMNDVIISALREIMKEQK